VQEARFARFGFRNLSWREQPRLVLAHRPQHFLHGFETPSHDEDNVVFDEELHGVENPPMDAGAALDRAQIDKRARRYRTVAAEFREVITLRELEGFSYKKSRISPASRSAPSCHVWRVAAANCK